MFVQTVEQKQGLKIACLEEIAFSKDWISIEQLKNINKFFRNSTYGSYLKQLVKKECGVP
ncbi:hypothetical protein [Legionella yabuuchiae]|uniref:hypothetical protein n=1 Tax=Legionella yabuuchiae TaxID=376727 RepID=UPI001A9453F9